MPRTSIGSGKAAPVAVDSSRAPLKCPTDLPVALRPAFRKLAALVADRVTAEDLPLMVQLVTAQSMAGRAAAELAANPVTVIDSRGNVVRHPAFLTWKQSVEAMIALGTHFGLTPASRARLHITDSTADVTLEDALYT